MAGFLFLPTSFVYLSAAIKLSKNNSYKIIYISLCLLTAFLEYHAVLYKTRNTFYRKIEKKQKRLTDKLQEN